MAALTVLAYLIATVTALCLVAGVAIVGPARLYRLRDDVVPRLRELRRQIALLGVVLLASAVGRENMQTFSELYGWYLTGLIFALEGDFVAWVQATFVSPPLTVYFSWIYIYGYVFLLVFPFIAYGALEETTTLKRLLTAYALNYAIGLVVYVVVLAHGPRNLMPDLVTSLLYTHNPAFQEFTSQINENTNVFPSLHSSLSVTVAVFAFLTREEYPEWTVLATWIAVSVLVSTMYLGIHWLSDVLAGTVLAFGTVVLSYRYVSSADEAPEGRSTAPEEQSTAPEE